MARHRIQKKHVVVGLDLSLTGTGCVILPAAWEPGSWGRVLSWQIGRPLKKGATDRERVERLQHIVDEIVDKTMSHFPTDIAVEDYPFAQMQSHTRSLAELGGVVKLALYETYDIVPKPVHSASWRKLLLGKVPKKNAKEIAQAEIRLAGCPKDWTGDQADAFGIANWMRSELGLSAMTLA